MHGRYDRFLQYFGHRNKPGYRWKDEIKIYLIETGCKIIERILLIMAYILSVIMNRWVKANSHTPCRAAKVLDCVFPIWFTQFGRVWFTHAMPRPCRSESDFSRPRHSASWAWHVWISVGRPETACGRPARVQLLPAATRSSTKVVIRSIPIR
jgi:hypothetical protein